MLNNDFTIHPRWGFIVMFIAVIAVNTPYFTFRYYPVHDTLSVYQFFSYYYSQIMTTGEIPWWLPYTAYGMPIDSYLLFSFGPFQYLTMFIGYIFQLQNTLLLFSLSLVGDTFFLAWGVYLFSRHICRSHWIAVYSVISVLLLVQYDRQIYWNFKILLPMPFCLYYIQRGIEKVNPAYLLLSLAALISWSFGSLAYALPVQFYMLACYGLALVLLRIKWKNISHVFWQISRPCILRGKFKLGCYRTLMPLKQPRMLLVFIGSCCVLSVCLYVMYRFRSMMPSEFAYNAVGRGADLNVDLSQYLNYGGNTGPEKVLEYLNGLPVSHPHDFLAFAGVINLALVVYGFFTKQKSISQRALALLTVLLIAYTVTATGVAAAAYHLPGMGVVRHIGYFVPVGKLFLIMLAGFGIRAYLDRITS